MAVAYYRLYVAKWGAAQTGAAAVNRLTLAANAGVFTPVDTHEELRQADFSALETWTNYQSTFLVNASPNAVKGTFRLRGITSGITYATAYPVWTAAKPMPFFSGTVLAVPPAADDRLEIQYSGYSSINFLAACWYFWRYP